MSCFLYKDIGRLAKDTLNDDYDFNRKLKIKTKTGNGVVFTAEGAMATNKSILAKMSGAFQHSSGINVSKVQVTTHGRLVGEASLKDALMKGLKLTFKAEDGTVKNTAGLKYRPVGKLGAEYTSKMFSTTAEADFANGNVLTSAVISYIPNVVVGGQMGINMEKNIMTDKDVAVSYTGGDFHASVGSKKNFNVISASMDHKPCSGVVYAASLDFDIKAETSALTIGGRYSPDKETTFCGKVNSEGIVSLALVQKLKPMMALTTGAQIDAKNIEGEAHKFGLGLTIG